MRATAVCCSGLVWLLAACGSSATVQASKGDAGADAHDGSDSGLGENDIPWPMFQRDPLHTGRASGRLGRNPSVRWTFPGDSGNYNINIAGVGRDGTVYAVQSADSASDPAPTLFALGPDGSLRWRAPLGPSPGGSQYEVISPDDGITLGTAQGCAHYSASGRLQWQSAGCNYVTAEEGGTLLIDKGDGALAAVDPDSGNTLWRAPSVGFSTSSGPPAVSSDGTIYVEGQQGLYAVHNDGSTAWSKSIVSPTDVVTSGPVVADDGTLYLGSIDGALYAVSPAGSLLWKGVARIAGDMTNNPLYYGALAVGSDGTVYFESQEENEAPGSVISAVLAAFGPGGVMKWSLPLSGTGWPRLILASDDTLILPTYDGTLLLVSTAGSIIATVPVAAPDGAQSLDDAALIADGTLYVGSYGGGLIAVAGTP